MAELRPYVPRVDPAGAAGGPSLSGTDLDPGFGARQSAASSALGARRRTIDAASTAGSAEAGVATARAEAAGARAEVGAALGQLGNTLAALDEQASKAARAATLANAKARFTMKQQEFASFLQHGDGTNPAPPAKRHLELYDKNTKQLLKEAEKEFGDDLASFAAFQNDFNQVTLNHRLDVLKNVVDRKSSDAIAEVKNGLRTTAHNAARTNPRARGPLLATAEQSVFDLETNGLINGETRRTILNGFYNDLSNADAMRMLKEDPDRALKTFRDAPLAGWDVDTQVKWADKAQQEIDRRAEKARRDRERAETNAKEAARVQREAKEKELYDAYKANDPGYSDKVAAAKETLTADQYRFYDELGRKPRDIYRNDRKYLDLMNRAAAASKLSQREKDEVMGDAYGLATGSAPELRASDVDAIRNELQGQDKKPRWEPRGRDYITGRFQGPGGILAAVQEKMDPVKARAMADALDDWGRWSIDHPEATDDDAERTYKRIAETALQIKKPADVPLQFAKVKPDGKVDYQATGQNIQQALMEGRIRLPEYNRQMRRLGQAKLDDPQEAQSGRAQ